MNDDIFTAVTITKIREVKVRCQMDPDGRGIVATVTVVAVLGSPAIGRLLALIEAGIPLEIRVSTRQLSFYEPDQEAKIGTGDQQR